MKINLSSIWVLTTDHFSLSQGSPMLVNRRSGVAFGPLGIVNPYLSWGPMLAADAVRRLAKTKKLDEEGQDLVARFVAGAEDIAAMAEDTIKDELGLGKKNPPARVKQIVNARQTIKDVRGDRHENKK